MGLFLHAHSKLCQFLSCLLEKPRGQKYTSNNAINNAADKTAHTDAGGRSG